MAAATTRLRRLSGHIAEASADSAPAAHLDGIARPPVPVFSAAEMEGWHRDGFIVCRDAVPAELCVALVSETWAHLGQDPADRSTWYTPPGREHGRADHHEGFVGARGDQLQFTEARRGLGRAVALHHRIANIFGESFSEARSMRPNPIGVPGAAVADLRRAARPRRARPALRRAPAGHRPRWD